MTIGLLVLMYILFVLIPGGAAAIAGFYTDREPPAYGVLLIPNIVVAIWGGICSAIVVMAGAHYAGIAQAGSVWWFSLIMGIISSAWLVGTFLYVSPQVRAAFKSLQLNRQNTPEGTT